jgi:hypothetical protein
MIKRLGPIVLAASLLAAPAFAHHGDAGRYEDTITTMSGTVVALQLINPHSMIIMDVADETGTTVRWQVELGAPAGLIRNFGWNKTTLKPGDKITVTGRRIKSGAPYFNVTEQATIVMTETGQEIFRTGVIPGTDGRVSAPPTGQSDSPPAR